MIFQRHKISIAGALNSKSKKNTNMMQFIVFVATGRVILSQKSTMIF